MDQRGKLGDERLAARSPFLVGALLPSSDISTCVVTRLALDPDELVGLVVVRKLAERLQDGEAGRRGRIAAPGRRGRVVERDEVVVEALVSGERAMRTVGAGREGQRLPLSVVVLSIG